MVGMSRKKAIFDGIFTKEVIVDDIHIDNKDNFKGGGERTIMI